MIHFILAGLATLLFPAFVSDTSLAFSVGVFALPMFAVLFFLLRSAASLAPNVRRRGFSHGLGLLFSLMTAFGYALDRLEAIPYGSITFIAAILVFTHVFAQGLSLLWDLLARKEGTFCAASSGRICGKGAVSSAVYRAVYALLERPALLVLLFLLCWAPCYLSTFPGNLIYDASYEYYQLENGFTRSFPLLHSAIITRLFAASEQLTGSVNAGVAVYVIAQMLLSALLFAHIVRKFHTRALHPALLGVMIAYYAAFPVVHLLVTCTTRDVLFSVLLTWLIYLFYLLASDTDAFMSSAKNVFLLAAVLVFTLLARNNNSGPLAVCLLFAVCVLICLAFGRRYIRRSLTFIASAVGLFLGVSAVLTALCQPLYDSPPSSSMSILTQPIARAYVLHGDTWPKEDQAAFESFFNMVTFEYVPQNADPSKGNLQVRYANMREFLTFWIRIGLRHPACYLDAFFANTQQMWFPPAIPDGYNVRGMYPGYDKCYFYFGRYVEEIGSRMNWLPGVFSFYEKIGLMISYEKIPLVSLLFSIGFHVWLLLHCVFYCSYRKCLRLFWPLSILLVYVVCCAFVPLVLLRYFGALMLVFPMVLAFTLCPAAVLPTKESCDFKAKGR